MQKIFNVNISPIDSYEKAFNETVKNLRKENAPVFITVNNVHTVIEATKNDYYRTIINHSFLSLPDGKPLSIYLRLKGNKNVSRIFGPTFFEKTLDWGQKDGLKHYFFGSSDATIDKMLKVINTKYPNAKIVGSFSPPYRDFTEEENNKFVADINDKSPDIIWVGLGAPKQEIWMYENYQKLNHGIMVGIGAGFDYLAGNTKHAPKWMKDFALEWLYRLIQEPKRLWKRYLITNSLFLWYCLLEILHLKTFNK